MVAVRVMVMMMMMRAGSGQVLRRLGDGERHLQRHGHDAVRGRRGQRHDRSAHEPWMGP